ncbi:hypothetical protein [Nocardioides sp. NPDC006303]|uniref:hypothetical protein n=1 Tax=Nocardioides sp. NPDC006303 TaxID=3156747 RepID=UPI0033BC84AF
MKISIDTVGDSFESAIKAIHAAYGVPYNADEDETPGTGDDYLPGKWTRPRLKKLVEWLDGSDAWTGLRYIAENAPAVDLNEVFAHMEEQTGVDGFDGKAMGGRMSAIGFGRNQIGGGVGPVYETDYNARKYRMDEKLAEALLEEMDAYESE